jgi:hypothetical protein
MLDIGPACRPYCCHVEAVPLGDVVCLLRSKPVVVVLSKFHAGIGQPAPVELLLRLDSRRESERCELVGHDCILLSAAVAA